MDVKGIAMTQSVTAVQGIGPHMAQILGSAGIKSVESLAMKTIEQLVAIEGIGRVKAEQFLAGAKDYLNGQGGGEAEPTEGAVVEAKKSKKAKKAKKDGKAKKGKKKKEKAKSEKSAAPKKGKKGKKPKKSKKSKKSKK